MRGKLTFVIASIALTTFVMGRVESLAAHRELGGSCAWAQNWYDDSAVAPDAKTPPPDVSGSYSGTVQDKRFGAGTLSADITQTGSKLSGTWETDINGGGGGTINGKVRPNGKVHLRLKITGEGGCGLNAQGVFTSPDEIAGKYQVTGCGKSDQGTFDIFD